MRAWRAWRRLEPPVDNFRHGHRNATTYNLECDLDHVVSSVSALGTAFMSGNDWDYVKRGVQELQEVKAIRVEVEGSAAIEPELRSKILRYVQATEAVLHAIVTAADPTTEVHGP